MISPPPSPLSLPHHVDCWVPPPPTPAPGVQRRDNAIAPTTPPRQRAHPDANLQKPH